MGSMINHFLFLVRQVFAESYLASARYKIYLKPHLLATLFLVTCLTDCGLFAVKEQHDKVASYCKIYGAVKSEVEDDKAMAVALFKFVGGDITQRENWQLFDHFVSPRPGKWYFFTSPGQYAVIAFKDVNRDMVYQLDEPIYLPAREDLIQCSPGTFKTDVNLVIPEKGRSKANVPLDISKLQVRTTDQQMAISLGQVSNIGTLIDLSDPRFAENVAKQSLWQPFDFLIDGNAGIYFLEPYSREKMPVLFVHGINGTPRDFNFLLDQLDRSHFQPWLVYYPSGAHIDNMGLYIEQTLQKLQTQYRFNNMVVVAHSMGGLVSRSFLFQHFENASNLAIPVFISISTPWNGHEAASLGVDYAPTPVSAWVDLAPGSRFLRKLFYADNPTGSGHRRLPETVANHLLFSFTDSVSGDGTVSLASQLRPEAQEEANRLYGFHRSHMDILRAPDTAKLINQLLEGLEQKVAFKSFNPSLFNHRASQ